jgi:hypothetical protein
MFLVLLVYQRIERNDRGAPGFLRAVPALHLSFEFITLTRCAVVVGEMHTGDHSKTTSALYHRNGKCKETLVSNWHDPTSLHQIGRTKTRLIEASWLAACCEIWSMWGCAEAKTMLVSVATPFLSRLKVYKFIS